MIKKIFRKVKSYILCKFFEYKKINTKVSIDYLGSENIQQKNKIALFVDDHGFIVFNDGTKEKQKG